MVLGYSTAAVSVTVGTISFLLGIQLGAIGFIFSPNNVPPENKSIFPNGKITFHDAQVACPPLVGVGIAITIFGYMLWYAHSKRHSSTAIRPPRQTIW